jgi:hypothetical protein
LPAKKNGIEKNYDNFPDVKKYTVSITENIKDSMCGWLRVII